MEFQVEILKLIQSIHNPLLDYFFILITNMGSEIFYFLLIPIIYWSIDKKLGLRIGVVLIISIYFNTIIKEVTKIRRPIGYPGIRSIFTISAGGYSFPSGHAQGSSTVWLYIASYYKSIKLYIIAIIIIAIISLSRLYLGVHWPSDIVGGILLGILIVLIANLLIPKLDKIRLNLITKIILSIIIPLILSSIYHHSDIYKYCGMLSGILIGYNVENNYIHFKSCVLPLKKEISKYILGLIGFILFYAGLKFILPDITAFHVLRYFILGLYLTLIAPYVFKTVVNV